MPSKVKTLLSSSKESKKKKTTTTTTTSNCPEDVQVPLCSIVNGVPSQLGQLDILKVLGKGAYGTVYLVRERHPRGQEESVESGGNVWALKSVDKRRISNSRTDVRHTRTERDVLASIEHPFIVRMVAAFETASRLYFLQEFCRGGELFRLLETERMMMEDEAKFYLAEIILALEYLHSKDILYRDLKTENVMLDEEGHVKLIDFGLSKIFSGNSNAKLAESNKLDNDNNLGYDSNDDPDSFTDLPSLTTHTFCGTVEYMAPEVVCKSVSGHGKPADWWSLGVFIFDLLTGRSPFHSHMGKKETKERILRAKFNVPAFVTAEAQDLIRKLLRKKIDKRLGSQRGAVEIQDHIFFTDIDWQVASKRGLKPPHVPQLDPSDPCDVSQFDDRFTCGTPRESERQDDEEKSGKLFDDFDYFHQDELHLDEPVESESR